MKTKDLLKERGSHTKKTAGPCNTGISCRLWRAGHLPLHYPLILTLKPILSLNRFLGPLPLLCCLFPALLPLPYSAAAALRRFIISSTSAFSITRGGTKRIILVPALINTSFCSSSAFDTMGPAGTENSNP